MEHKNQKYIVCPYCGWQDDESWKFTTDDGTHICGSCENEFNVSRYETITYDTSKINCEDSGIEHNYQFLELYISKRAFDKGGVVRLLPESEWKYNRIRMCTICEDKEYTEITRKEYYEQELLELENNQKFKL